VAEALKALENAGVLSWVHRIKWVREACPDLLGDNGWRWRVLRTSNAYALTDPTPAADRPFRAERGFVRRRETILAKKRSTAGNSNLATAAALIARRSSSTRSLAIWP
jgi:hypothetical protein